MQDPAAGLTPWGTTLHLSVPDGAVGVSVTRTVVNHLGQELSAEYDVPCSAAGEVTHTPFGGIFAAPCPDGTVYVRYSPVYAGADAPEEITVRSAFPDFANSDLAARLAAALADGDAEQALPSVSGDTAGDGNDKVVALWLTEDGIPFLTADNAVVLCLGACDPARYEGADMQAFDLGDGRDAVVIVWEQLWDMELQCAVQDADGWHELEQAAADLSAMPVYLNDRANITMGAIRSQCKAMARRGRCGMVIIDYLQLLDTASRNTNSTREREIAAASRSAKLLAKELDVPVILLSQLSRKVEERTDKTPLLSDLRESGAIEQDADMVLFLDRPAMYGRTEIDAGRYGTISAEGVGLLHIAKNREGATGSIVFRHNESLTRIADYDSSDVGPDREAGPF